MTFFSAIGNFFVVSWNFISGPFTQRILDIFNAPFTHHNMLWMLLPLLATLLLMEFYFGRYKDEELGWNTAFGNSLVLMFVAVDSFRHVYEPIGGSILSVIFSKETKIIISLVIFGFALLLMFIDFFHFLPKKAAYIISSPVYINLIGLLGIIIVYATNIPLDLLTLLSCLMIFLLVNVLSIIIYLIVPSYKPPIHRILGIEETENKKKTR
jgi:hypothetical protein